MSKLCEKIISGYFIFITVLYVLSFFCVGHRVLVPYVYKNETEKETFRRLKLNIIFPVTELPFPLLPTKRKHL